MSQDKAAWTEIRCAYEAGDEPVAAVAARFGVSEGSIYRRARRDSWARRSKLRKRGTTSGPRKGKSKGTKSGQSDYPAGAVPPDTNLIERLYKAMDAKLKQLEARMGADQEISAAESERETRELGSMIRSFEKVTAFASANRGRDDKQRNKVRFDPGDTERMREEIAERLERLCPQGEAPPEPGTTE
jgi:hypothetical protein